MNKTMNRQTNSQTDLFKNENPCILINNLNHCFGHGETRKQILYENNLNILPGELVIMTGPSGSGKTTLLTLIGALRSVQEGSVKILGREFANMSKRDLVSIRREIGFIFQLHNLFSALTAYQNVRMSLELWNHNYKKIDKLTKEILCKLGLEDRIFYKPNKLSGGQRQRVAVARGLANKPKLVLADEPTAALDKESGRIVVDLLKKLTIEEKSTVVIVTHDNRILDAADRIINIIDGHIVSNVLVNESIMICGFLSECSVFKSLSTQIISETAQEMVKESYPKETVLFKQGDMGDKFYLIRQGVVEIIKDDTLIRTQKKGDFFGEMALLTGEPRSATVVAKEDLTLYSLTKDKFRNVMEKSDSFKEQLLKVFFQRS